MSLNARINCGTPALLEFRGPDAVRFLNGQVTQDVRKLDAEKISLPSCVTDAKGRLQFRVWLMKSVDDALWVSATEVDAEALEARLTRYLIADDVEVTNLSGQWTLVHFTADPGAETFRDRLLRREPRRVMLERMLHRAAVGPLLVAEHPGEKALALAFDHTAHAFHLDEVSTQADQNAAGRKRRKGR